MWDAIVDRLKRLKSIDGQCQVFGARAHRYLLHPCLPDAEIAAVEHRLGVALPPCLRAFYAEVGDGIAGPCYGLKPACELTGYRPADEYPGIEELRRLAAAEGTPPDDSGYFEVLPPALAGLLPVIDEGCGHEICLVTKGNRVGDVVCVSGDGFVVETQKSLRDVYAEWLDEELERFDAVLVLMQSNKTLQQIEGEMLARFDDLHAADRMVSIADVKKPVNLFGDGNTVIHHKAVQQPWFEAVLQDWRQKSV